VEVAHVLQHDEHFSTSWLDLFDIPNQLLVSSNSDDPLCCWDPNAEKELMHNSFELVYKASGMGSSVTERDGQWNFSQSIHSFTSKTN